MSSSPQRSPRNTPRSTPKPRTPLQERTQSEANEISSRLQREPKQPAEGRNLYATSPFPTKPQHILLPSTIRKRKSSQNLYTDIFAPQHGGAARAEPTEPASSGKHPAVRLKRSVKTLRDMYEAQSEDSRPATALSSSRPGTASSKLRSFSSSEGLSGRYAWENFKITSSDDLALLPSLPEGQSSWKRPQSQSSSFASRAARYPPPSSPNFRILGATSSPRIPEFKSLSEVSSEVGHSRTTDATSYDESLSSPNVVKLGRTSSLEDIPSLDPPSSPILRPGISPARTLVAVPPSSPLRRRSSTSSDGSRKRRRTDTDEGQSFAARSGGVIHFPSSPPMAHPNENSSPSTGDLMSSDLIQESSPVVRVLHDGSSDDQRAIADTHASLQEAISSSPQAPIQYPVVRAPTDVQQAGIVIPKRKYRSSHTSESLNPRWPSRLSAPSQESLTRSRNASIRSSWTEEHDDFDMESLAPAQSYILASSANNSQIRIVPDSDRQEGEDEVSALPGEDYPFGAPSVPNRSTSYLSSNSSSQSRINSIDVRLDRIRTYSLSRQNSLRSFRPDSSSSSMTQLAVPTWARRYYSGFYPDSFRFLAASGSNVAVNQIQSPLPPIVQTRPESMSTAQTSRQSIQSLGQSITERISSSLVRLRNRPRLEARKSHTMPGMGPLVSNPVGSDAIIPAQEGFASGALSPRRFTRPVSFPLPPADPRAHWNGISNSPNTPFSQYSGNGLQHHPLPAHHRPTSSDPSQRACSFRHPHPPAHNRFQRRPSFSPHLHHDRRLNTGSTTSRGFGAPFNRKSYLSFSAPSVKEEPDASAIRTGKNVQIACFVLGFVLPLSWFLGAALRLPRRPEGYGDLEKRYSQPHWGEEGRFQDQNGGYVQDPFSTGPTIGGDVSSRLRREKQYRGGEEILWQNVRWWRTLNRWMCVVGALVLVLVIVLAVVGTTAWGG